MYSITTSVKTSTSLATGVCSRLTDFKEGSFSSSRSDFFRQKHFEDLGHEPGYYQITGEKAPEEKSILLRFEEQNQEAGNWLIS